MFSNHWFNFNVLSLFSFIVGSSCNIIVHVAGDFYDGLEGNSQEYDGGEKPQSQASSSNESTAEQEEWKQELAKVNMSSELLLYFCDNKPKVPFVGIILLSFVDYSLRMRFKRCVQCCQ